MYVKKFVSTSVGILRLQSYFVPTLAGRLSEPKN